MTFRPGPEKRRSSSITAAELNPIQWALHENPDHQDWYDELIERSQDLLCIHNLQGHLLSVNPGPARALGYSVKELLRIPMRDLVAPEYRERFDSYLTDIQRTGEARGLLAVLTRSGERRIWQYRNALRPNGVGIPVVRGMAHDVTNLIREQQALRISHAQLLKKTREQERTQEALRQREADLNRAQAVAHIGSWRFQFQQRQISFSDETYRILGLPAGSLLQSEDARQRIFADDLNRVRAAWNRALVSGKFECEHRILVENEIQWVRTLAEFEYDSARVPLLAVGTVQDITELRNSLTRQMEFERVVENLEEMILVVDRDYRYILVNPAFLRYWHTTADRVIGRPMQDLLPPETFEAVRPKLEECFRSNVVKYEMTLDYPVMGRRDLAVTYTPISGPSGVERAACVLRDITEQRQSEQALRESEARERSRSKDLEAVLNAVPAAVCIAHDPEGRSITGNGAAYEQLGVPPGSNISRSALESERPPFRVLEHGIEVQPHLLPIQQAAATGQALYHRPLTLVLQDGTIKETIANVVPLFDDEGNPRGAVATSVDVTELNRAEQALRASEARFRSLYENAPSASRLSI
jgi:PAS domain S-box-containing protein